MRYWRYVMQHTLPTTQWKKHLPLRRTGQIITCRTCMVVYIYIQHRVKNYVSHVYGRYIYNVVYNITCLTCMVVYIQRRVKHYVSHVYGSYMTSWTRKGTYPAILNSAIKWNDVKVFFLNFRGWKIAYFTFHKQVSSLHNSMNKKDTEILLISVDRPFPRAFFLR